MNNKQIIRNRLFNQHLGNPQWKSAEEAVTHMIAMQSQEYTMAKWAIGLRTAGLTEKEVEKEFNEGKILRTHVMRPTWHFVAPADIRWLLSLTAPRIRAISKYYFRRAGLDSKLLNKTVRVLEKILRDNNFLTRTSIQQQFEKEKITAAGERLSYIMINAELDGIICSGPRQGKQFTYALLEERAAPQKKLSRPEALAQFAERYFASRGPASVNDFAYWSGLTVKDARDGAAALPPSFRELVIDNSGYFLIEKPIPAKQRSTFLMPDYDEYGMSYKNRDAILNAEMKVEGSTVFSHWIVINGQIAGTWQRVEKNKKIAVVPVIPSRLPATAKNAVNKAIKDYCDFFNNV
jgi:hypothetical protein